jgi:DNA-binding NarL/FixJ family response regulator
MADLLRRLTAACTRGAPTSTGGAIPVDYLGRLLQAFQLDRETTAQEPEERAGAAMPGPAVVLTPRELEVLALLEAGKSNRQIDDQFVVTVDT